MTALLAVLKAGAAYLPVDPAYPGPADRLHAGRRPSGVRADHRRVRGRCRGQPVPLAVLDDPVTAAEIAGRPERLTDDDRGGRCRRASGVRHLHLGVHRRPQGRRHPHAGIANRLLWMQSEYGLEPDDRVMQKTPASFDVSVWEFFWPLLEGAQLVVARPGGQLDPAYLADLVNTMGVTTVHFVPAMLELFSRR